MQKRKLHTVTEEDVLREYVNAPRASLRMAGDALGCSRETVRRALRRYGYEVQLGRGLKGGRKSTVPQLADREWLAKELETKSAAQIARDLGTSYGNVSDRIYRYELRPVDQTKSEAIKAGLRKAYPEGRFGSEASNWKGGRHVANQSGYIQVYCPDHPRASKAGYMMEHRLVAEQHLGRYLRSDEIVHHKDGNRANNDWANLSVATRSKHVAGHFARGTKVMKLEREMAEMKAELALAIAKLARYEELYGPLDEKGEQ